MSQDNPDSRKMILLADDDGALRKSIADLLAGSGYGFIVASDGKEALEEALAYDGEIHLLLSAVELPGMTGIELSAQLRQARPSTRVLLFSGLESGILVLNHHGWQWIPKPFLSDKLRDQIRDSLSEPSPA